jgi:hypothetical protein
MFVCLQESSIRTAADPTSKQYLSPIFRVDFYAFWRGDLVSFETRKDIYQKMKQNKRDEREKEKENN